MRISISPWSSRVLTFVLNPCGGGYLTPTPGILPHAVFTFFSPALCASLDSLLLPRTRGSDLRAEAHRVARVCAKQKAVSDCVSRRGRVSVDEAFLDDTTAIKCNSNG